MHNTATEEDINNTALELGLSLDKGEISTYTHNLNKQLEGFCVLNMCGAEDEPDTSVLVARR